MVADVKKRLVHARTKHPEFATGVRNALCVIWSEVKELGYACVHEGRKRSYDELLDVLATVVRFVRLEWRRQ